MPLFLSIYAFGITGALYHLYTLSAAERTKARIIEVVLLYQIVFSLGVTSLVAFLGLTFMADYVAKYTNWPACPFQQQLANVNLAFGTLGLLAIRYRGLFWTATIIGFSIWIVGDGIHHLVLAITTNNWSDGNVGIPLWTDILVPLILLILLYIYNKETNIRETS